MCTVAYTELRSAKFNLILGDLIVVRVRAVNEIGQGDFSVLNISGDLVKTQPRSPPQAPSEGATTNDSQIEITWTALSGIDAGFDTVTRYQLYWDNGSSGIDWVLLATQNQPTFTHSFTKVTGIKSGQPY